MVNGGSNPGNGESSGFICMVGWSVGVGFPKVSASHGMVTVGVSAPPVHPIHCQRIHVIAHPVAPMPLQHWGSVPGDIGRDTVLGIESHTGPSVPTHDKWGIGPVEGFGTGRSDAPKGGRHGRYPVHDGSDSPMRGARRGAENSRVAVPHVTCSVIKDSRNTAITR